MVLLAHATFSCPKRRNFFAESKHNKHGLQTREAEGSKSQQRKDLKNANRENMLDQIGGNDSCRGDNNFNRQVADRAAAGDSIVLTNTNQLSITVTNGVAYGNYSLYNQHVLGGSPLDAGHTNAVPGVTNFLVGTGPYFQGFYHVTGSTNWNNNGIPNWDYADPNNPGLGVLTVTIVSPSQGQIIQ